MPADKKINYVEFPAADFDVIEAFYTNTFGWAFTDFGPEYRVFNDGQFDGGFFKSDLCSSTANGAALVVLFAEDLEGLQDSILTNGGRICKEIFSFPGGRRFHFLDPHGNELAVWSDK